MLRHREFDVAEMSLSTYAATLGREDPPFVALPVVTSRMFRHGGIFANSAAGIDQPSDLRGKRVGNAEFQLTANVWIRGTLTDEHDVPIDSVTYLSGGRSVRADREGCHRHAPRRRCDPRGPDPGRHAPHR